MFSPPPRCFHKQKSHAPKLTLLSPLQQDVDKLNNEKRYVGSFLRIESRHFFVGLAVSILFCGCYFQPARGFPSLTVLENKARINLKDYHNRHATPRTLFRSPVYIKDRLKDTESQSSSHPPCDCDGKLMRACSEECMRKNTTNLVSETSGSSFAILSDGQTVESIVTGGTTSSSSVSSGGLVDDELGSPTDVADAADQDLEELINTLSCDCSRQVKPSCVAACASRKDTSSNNNTSSCFCDGKLFDSCPQKCIPIRATKVENIGESIGSTSTIIGGFSSGGARFTNRPILTGGSSTSDGAFINGRFNSANYRSNMSSFGMDTQIMDDFDGGINITTGKLNPVPSLQPTGPPCICEEKYHRVCTVECLRIKTTKQLPYDQIPGGVSISNSAPPLPPIGTVDDHPDHGTNEAFPVRDLDPLPDKPKLQRPPPTSPNLALPPTNGAETVVEENGEIIRHRKVYITEKPRVKSVVRPFRITIPIKLEEPQTTYIDPPPPVFKMRTYTEYETKPETVQMPIVTTVIKPKNVRKEQIVN